MMMKEDFLKYVETILQQKVGQGLKIKSVHPVGGGCINNGAKLDCGSNSFFIKYNSSFHGMFMAEEKGLTLLKHSTLHIPQVITTGRFAETDFIILEFIKSGVRKKTFFSDMGLGLATLHKNTSSLFGLDHHNYIGSLQQDNTVTADGIQFFIQHRLIPLVDKAGKENLLPLHMQQSMEVLYKKLNGLLPAEAPALLHGDLWSGNYMGDENGDPCLIDPAVYYGCRETDIAMTVLFGGFDAAFYEAYEDAFPMINAWKERTDLWNLYPLLVHLNLFGGSYLGDIERIIRRYV